jgi:hypothetical protein
MQAMRALLPLLALSVVVAAVTSASAQQPRVTEITLQPGPALSRGALFHSLAGFRIPPGGLVAGIVCTVSQPDGRLTDCRADDKTPAAALPALRRRLKPTAVLPPGANRPRAAPVLGRASIVLTPEDYPDLTAETAYTAKTLKLTSEWKGWAVKPAANVIERLYPERALRLDREARVAAICQIQSDGSLACPVVDSTVRGMGFEQAGLWVLEAYRAKPRLPGGRRSAGAWVRMMVDFKLA